jgi:cytoskeletal protein RodZ
MESVGEYLKRERELRKVTLEEIASVTRICTRYLQALEDGDYESIPAEVFVRGFLRAYAKCVGLSPNDIISKYEMKRKEEDYVLV